MTMMTFQLCAYLSRFTQVERIKPNSFPQPGNCVAEVNRGDQNSRFQHTDACWYTVKYETISRRQRQN